MSVCKKYTFNNYIDHIFADATLGLEEVIEKVGLESRDITELFYFFSHPGMLNLTFPCTTILGGNTPGRPCIFPITWENNTHNQCFDMRTPDPGCFTRVVPGNIVGPDDARQFGYCSDCNGETVRPDSPYNLAQFKYSGVWNSDFSDLRTYENGLCHTYNPPETSNTSFLGRIYFMIRKGFTGYQSYDIFIHEKGQFWPRSDMNSYGQTDVVTVSPHTELELELSVKKIENLKKDHTHCIEDENYSLTQCLKEYVFTKTKEKTRIYILLVLKFPLQMILMINTADSTHSVKLIGPVETVLTTVRVPTSRLFLTSTPASRGDRYWR